MEIERKALYNLVRMNWLNEADPSVEPWQVEDYRALKENTIFHTLNEWDLPLDYRSFFKLSEGAESPEILTDLLIENLSLEPDEQDQIFLLIFELWRRFLPEKQCLSIFCDELDHQIFLHDKADPRCAESIQDLIANLQMIMDENADQGVKPTEIFNTIASSCANDLESFLYDFISEQMESDNISYASELVEGLSPYLKGSKWFELLVIRLLEQTDSETAHEELKKIVQRSGKDEDLPFNLEVLSIIVQAGGRGEFNKMVRQTVPILEKEEDFKDLLALSADYYNCIDEDQKEVKVQNIIESRMSIALDQPLNPKDKHLSELLKIIR